MVTGGFGTEYLDTSEVYADNVWRTVAGKLPAGMLTMRSTSVNNRVLLLGR